MWACPCGARICDGGGGVAPCACVRATPSVGLRKFGDGGGGGGGPRACDGGGGGGGARAPLPPLPVAPRASTRAGSRTKIDRTGNAARQRSPRGDGQRRARGALTSRWRSQLWPNDLATARRAGTSAASATAAVIAGPASLSPLPHNRTYIQGNSTTAVASRTRIKRGFFDDNNYAAAVVWHS